MSKKAVVKKKKQPETWDSMTSSVMGQLVLPMLLGIEATRKGLLNFVQEMGLRALQELLAVDAAAIAGPKGAHAASRTHNHWGTTTTPLNFGGRTILIPRPRVRRRDGGEVKLPIVEAFQNSDPMADRVLEQILVGVSTRGYGRSLEPVTKDVRTRGTSKSRASRALIEKTAEHLEAFVTQPLGDVELVAMFLDGIEVGDKSVVVALGVKVDGTKVPLGLWLGSTENAVVVTALAQDLVERGLRIEGRLLFVIDGGKAIRKALKDVFGDRALVQRCQVHKVRNVKEHLPEARRGYVAKLMRQAYTSTSVRVAKKLLQQLVSWLESNGEDSAAQSVREGLDETLTVLGLNLPKTLTRSFSTTNAIENMNGTVRRTSRNVKRWRGEGMIRRWMALGIAQAAKGFRRIKGHAQMSALITVLRSGATTTPVRPAAKGRAA